MIPDEAEFQVAKQSGFVPEAPGQLIDHVNRSGTLRRLLEVARGQGSYFTRTLGSTDMPTRKRCCGSWPFSNTIFTGIRCTTLT
jgi:hypothetical protein